MTNAIETNLFWHWFTKNKEKYVELSYLDREEQEYWINEIGQQLFNYCGPLGCEIMGDIENNNFSLTITAERNRNNIERVENLVACAPEIENWQVIAFRPARADIGYGINFEGIKLSPEELVFIPLLVKDEPHKLMLRMLIKDYDYSKKDRYMPVINDIIENVIGEKSMMLDIYYVELVHLSGNIKRPQSIIPIRELPLYIQQWKRDFNLA